MDRFRTSPNRSEPVLNQFGKWIDKKTRKKQHLVGYVPLVTTVTTH